MTPWGSAPAGCWAASPFPFAVIFPISAFVTLGFEHSIANIYFFPVALFSGAEGVTLSGFIGNLVPVTLGNIAGGSGFVGLMFAFAYLRGEPERSSEIR
jgi:formate/nitrite transporter FocA (FNT family)